MGDKTAVLILAAGKSTRMRSELPKVLHPLAGRPLLSYVMETAKALRPEKILCVIGHKAESVRKAFPKENAKWVLQKQQLGTAHAVLCGLEALKGLRGSLLILSGDVPLLKTETLGIMKARMAEEQASMVVLTTRMQDPKGYGRIVRGGFEGKGEIERIVEERDAEDWEKAIREINTGTYLARCGDVRGPLSRVKKSIAKGEYYLTDLIHELIAEGKKVSTVETPDALESMGVNTREELAQADAELQRRLRRKWMEAGVTMISPETIRIDADVTLEPDVVLHPGVVVTGASRIEKGAEILPYSVIENSRVRQGGRVGPFAHLRPGCDVGPGAHVGNFVELKKTRLGPGAKANHLAYLGDATVGARANIGAGTITCNYDGFHKYPTVIGEDAFIGSDTQLVAPVKVGRQAWIGAGTTVTKDVPAGTLAISRSEQKNIPNYDLKKRRLKKSGKR